MQVKYDFHIHSGLSPCAEDDMTPANIVGFASLSGLNMIAIADHNAIGNVETAIKAGKEFGVAVVPAFELQTLEDIHLLCILPTLKDLQDFYSSIKFPFIKNRPEIFGNQLIFDEDDNVVGREERLLHASAEIYSGEVSGLIERFGGIAVPAHVDREGNGMAAILGCISPEFGAVELSTRAGPALKAKYESAYTVIVDSDAHALDQISTGSVLELEEPTPKALIGYLKRGKKQC